MKKTLLALLIAGSLALAQNTALMPETPPALKDLGVAKNRAESALATGITASETSINVLSGSGFGYPGFITIDNEVMAICNVTGNTLKIGYSACPNVDGRGYDNTSAVTHLAAAKAQQRIVSWNQNQIAAEMIATATKLHVELPSVKDVGAHGNGADDDTAHIQAGIDGGRSVLVPGDKTYRITGPLEFLGGTNDDTTLYCGSGAYIKGNFTGSMIADNPLVDVYRVRILGCNLDDTTRANTGSYGLNIWGCKECAFRDLHISNVEMGLNIQAGTHYTNFDNVQVDGVVQGWYMLGHQNTIIGGRVNDSTNGIHLTGNGQVLLNTSIEIFTGYGLRLSGQYKTVISPRLENPSVSAPYDSAIGLDIEDNCSECVVINPTTMVLATNIRNLSETTSILTGSYLHMGIGAGSLDYPLSIRRTYSSDYRGLLLSNAHAGGYGMAITFQSKKGSSPGVFDTARLYTSVNGYNAGVVNWQVADATQTLRTLITLTDQGMVLNRRLYVYSPTDAVYGTVMLFNQAGTSAIEMGNNNTVNYIRSDSFGGGFRPIALLDANVLVGTTTDNTLDILQVNGTALAVRFIFTGLHDPGPTDACRVGEFVFGSSYAYFCVATDTWKKVAIS
jgi:hypothetical protein